MVAGNELIEALDVAVYTTDSEGRITFYNTAAAKLWGHEPELGSLWCGSWKLFHADGSPLAHSECPMAVTLKEGVPVRSVEAILERPDGVRIPFRPYPTPLRDADGNITGAINLLMDLSDRHRLDHASARLAAIVTSSDDAILSKTLDGVITSWNSGAERIFGYTESEMVGQSILQIIPPELRDEEKTIIARLAQGERIDHFETVRSAKDGRRINISLTVSPLRDAFGNIVGASKVARDITERKRAEETQRLLRDELNHRIKNTLATVQAIASQTLRRSTSPAVFVTSFNGRIQALARAHTLLTRNSFHGAEILQLVRDQVTMGVDDRRVSCSGPDLMLDAQAALHLALVMHELGTNARKHGALSAPSGTVSVNWEVRTNGGRKLVLTWTEIGGPKVTAPAASGFGTMLIEQSLRAHGGEASMRYAEAGVSCEISLPLSDISAALGGLSAENAVRPSGVRRVDLDASRLSGLRVLVVEDEALIAMVLVECLTDAGCTVVGPVHTLENAKAAIADSAFDVALLDANLSGRPVDELAAALTQKGTPFAFVTGYGREGLPRAFQHALTVEKPFNPEQVLAALERLLSRDDNVLDLNRPKAS